VRGWAAGVCAVLLAIGCAGCAQQTQTTLAVPTSAVVSPQQQCVGAVFTVLAGMVSRPYDNHPFEDFVTHYGPGSVTYSAYRDAFTPFYDLAATEGVRGAEDRLRASVTRECAAAR
jgi:hypothetical protein